MHSKRKVLQKIYRRLYQEFGPQHWWPADTPFEVIVGAVLTQNTNWGNVERAIKNLKRARALSLHKIYQMPPKKLARLIRPAGYFNVKAKRLKNVINFLYNRYQGNLNKLFSKNVKTLRRQLLEINGVGPETADSIILYAAKKPNFVVDAYTKRILARHGLINGKADYTAVQNLFMMNLARNERLFNEYHALLVRLAKEICLNKNAKCEICPLKEVL